MYIVGQCTPTSPNIKTIDWITSSQQPQQPSCCSIMFCWETLDPDSHVDAKWRKPTTQTGQCHTTETVQERPEERVSDLQVFTSPPNGPRSRLSYMTRACKMQLCGELFSWGVLLCVFYGSENIQNMNTRTQGFPLQLCTVTMITVLHLSLGLLLWLLLLSPHVSWSRARNVKQKTAYWFVFVTNFSAGRGHSHITLYDILSW